MVGARKFGLLILFFLIAFITTNVYSKSYIYPVPKNIVLKGDSVSIIGGIKILIPEEADQSILEGAMKSVFDVKKNNDGFRIKLLNLGAEKRVSKREKIEAISGAYRIKITKRRAELIGYDTRGLFYAIQSFRQLIDRSKEYLPLLDIYDYPDMTVRGIVEGFYGTPWSYQDHISQLEYYGENKLNTFIYAPKDDPFHSKQWRDAYPSKEANQIKELVNVAQRNNVNFFWAIHPGGSYTWDGKDYKTLIAKLEQVYSLGVRGFSVFFDDIVGESVDAQKQADLLNNIQRDFVQKHHDILPLMMCPTEYNRAWAKTNYLSLLGKNLDKNIDILWTGDKVVGDINKNTLKWIYSLIDRKPIVWFNYPVNDYCQDKLLMGKFVGITKDAYKLSKGVVINPMLQAEASKIAEYGLSAFSWSAEEYNSQEVWNQALRVVGKDSYNWLRLFSENSTDPGANCHQFHRPESEYLRSNRDLFWNELKTGHSDKIFTNFNEYFDQLSIATDRLWNQCDNIQLIKEINPWLLQLQDMGRLGKAALKMVKTAQEDSQKSCWMWYNIVQEQLQKIQAYDAYLRENNIQNGAILGTQVFLPFIEDCIDSTQTYFQSKFNFEYPISPIAFSSFTNKEGLSHITDNNPYSYYYTLEDVEDGDFVGIDLQKEQWIYTLDIIQARNSQDSRYFTSGQIEYSIDNIHWNKLGDIKTHREIHYRESPFKARYIRYRALNIPKTNRHEWPCWLAIRSFCVNNYHSELYAIYSNDTWDFDIKENRNSATLQSDSILSLSKNEYFGIAIPKYLTLKEVSFNSSSLRIETSVDRVHWIGYSASKLSDIRYIRGINYNESKISVVPKWDLKFNKKIDSKQDVFNALDNSLQTYTTIDVNDFLEIKKPSGAKSMTLLLNSRESLMGKIEGVTEDNKLISLGTLDILKHIELDEKIRKIVIYPSGSNSIGIKEVIFE